MPVVAEEQLVRKYVAGWLSIAYFFNLACSIALVILPFVFAYSSDCVCPRARSRARRLRACMLTRGRPPPCAAQRCG